MPWLDYFQRKFKIIPHAQIYIHHQRQQHPILGRGAWNTFESTQNMCPKIFSTFHGRFTKSRHILYTHINMGVNVSMRRHLCSTKTLSLFIFHEVNQFCFIVVAMKIIVSGTKLCLFAMFATRFSSSYFSSSSIKPGAFKIHLTHI